MTTVSSQTCQCFLYVRTTQDEEAKKKYIYFVYNCGNKTWSANYTKLTFHHGHHCTVDTEYGTYWYLLVPRVGKTTNMAGITVYSNRYIAMIISSQDEWGL
jgi:hypothetical protein